MFLNIRFANRDKRNTLVNWDFMSEGYLRAFSAG